MLTEMIIEYKLNLIVNVNVYIHPNKPFNFQLNSNQIISFSAIIVFQQATFLCVCARNMFQLFIHANLETDQ